MHATLAMVVPASPATPATVDAVSFATSGRERLVPLASIRRDPRAQPRARLNPDTVETYRAAMAPGEGEPAWGAFPAVVLYQEGDVYHLADGFHRLAAAEAAGLKQARAEVRTGGLRDAILYSVGANATHGLPRSNEDKRRAVAALLSDPEWSAWSDRAVAARALVSHTFVANQRAEQARGEATGNGCQSDGEAAPEGDWQPLPVESKAPTAKAPTVRKGRDGRVIRTEKIGKRLTPASRATPPIRTTDPKRRELLVYLDGYNKGRREAEKEASQEVILRTPQNLRASTDKGRKWLEAPAQRAVYEADQLAQYMFSLACGMMNESLPEDLRAQLATQVFTIRQQLAGIAKDTNQHRLTSFLSVFLDHVTRCKKAIAIYQQPIADEDLPRDPQLAIWRRQEIEERSVKLTAESPTWHAQQVVEQFARNCPDDGAKISLEALDAAMRAFVDEANRKPGGNKKSKYELLSLAIASTRFAQTKGQLADRLKDREKPSKQKKNRV